MDAGAVAAVIVGAAEDACQAASDGGAVSAAQIVGPS
jgi:hypothetical protein